MYPILFEDGSFVLPAWHALFVTGALAAFFLMLFLRRKYFSERISDRDVRAIFALGYVGGYFGARTFSIIVEQEGLETIGEFFEELTKFGSMTFYGGMLGVFVAVSAYALARRLPYGDILDLGLCAGMLGLAFGRIGCFLNGDDYGIPLTLYPDQLPPWWSVTFPNHKNPIPRYPVQLFEAAFAGGLAYLSVHYFATLRQRFYPGAVGMMLAASYGVFRFFMEFLRGDHRGWIVIDVLSPSQIISVSIVVLVGVVAALRRFTLRST